MNRYVWLFPAVVLALPLHAAAQAPSPVTKSASGDVSRR